MIRLIRLHLASRRTPAALAAIAACAVILWAAQQRRWDAYGALQLPLMFEAACASVVAVAMTSPFGEPEGVTGRRLRWLRLGTAGALSVLAAAALAATHPAGGSLAVVRNVAGLIGLGLLCATLLGGALAWTGPAAYMILGVYALYTQWHGPALSTPWIWPGRPGTDAGGAICAGLIFAAGLAAVAARGCRDTPPPAG